MALPQPVGRQRDVLWFGETGHLIVLGSAGSGKTTLAILRARWLAQDSPNKGRTLLVTYNRMLRTYLDTLEPAAMHGVEVRNYHQVARGYLSSRGKLGDGKIVPEQRRLAFIETGLAKLRTVNPSARVLRHPIEAIGEELAWIARMGIRTLDSYRHAERINRGGLRIAGSDRDAIWTVREEYLRARAAGGYLVDWEDISSAVLDELRQDTESRRFRHIVIDEGQDFSPEMLRSLAAAIPAGGSLTFFGDIAQQIYGSRLSWRDSGLVVPQGGVVHFRENYRNTKQIAEFALAIASGPHFLGDPDMVAPRAPSADGPLPALARLRTREAEVAFIVRLAAAAARAQSVGILLRDRTQQSAYVSGLRAVGVPVRVMDKNTPRWTSDPGVWVGTYYSGKGLEFQSVFLPHLDAETVPNNDRLIAIGDQTVGFAEEARLLYVACTRARATLVMTYSGDLTPLFGGIPPSCYRHTEMP